MKNGTYISFADLFLIISSAQERQRYTVSTQRRLDYVGDITLLRLVIKVSQILAGGILVLRQVIIRPVRNSPQLAPSDVALL